MLKLKKIELLLEKNGKGLVEGWTYLAVDKDGEVEPFRFRRFFGEAKMYTLTGFSWELERINKYFSELYEIVKVKK